MCYCVSKDMDGYSGSDIRLVCKEAAMRPVRKIFDALESHQDGRKKFTHIPKLACSLSTP